MYQHTHALTAGMDQFGTVVTGIPSLLLTCFLGHAPSRVWSAINLLSTVWNVPRLPTTNNGFPSYEGDPCEAMLAENRRSIP